jgi:hypothetical protein
MPSVSPLAYVTYCHMTDSVCVPCCRSRERLRAD